MALREDRRHGSSRNRSVVSHSCRLLEEHDAGRVAMDEVLTADRTDFAHGEEARDGYRSIVLVNHPHVVIGFVEEPRAATVACEEQQGKRGHSQYRQL